MSELEELKLAYAECSRQRNELLNKLKSQAQQEPVAWMDDDGNLHREKPHQSYGPEPRPLVFCDTSPPAQRTWVGLTDEEIARVVSLAGFSPDWAEAHIATQIVRVLEAKLRSKNEDRN